MSDCGCYFEVSLDDASGAELSADAVAASTSLSEDVVPTSVYLQSEVMLCEAPAVEGFLLLENGGLVLTEDGRAIAI